MQLVALTFLTFAMCHAEVDPEDSKKFLDFAKNYDYYEHAAITERRINEVSKIKEEKNPRDFQMGPGGFRGPRGPGDFPGHDGPRFPKPNPEDSLRFSTIDHHSDRTDITSDIPLDQLFQNGTTLLQPQATEGPFFVGGELIRDEITDGEPGVPLWISANFYDITTGKPVEMHWEVWHCNATGAYSGVDSPMNANGDNLLNETFLRGIQKTDKNGAATFKTIFPGHYSGRAVHIHMMAHIDATEYENGTIGIGENESSGRVAHVGQFFFDDVLIEKVERLNPYTSNTHPRTANKDDREVGTMSTKDAPDPFMKYVLLGDKVEDGIYAWISIGIDASASYKPSMAAYRTDKGGVMLPGRHGPGGPGGPHWGKDGKSGKGKVGKPGKGNDGKPGKGKDGKPHKGKDGHDKPGNDLVKSDGRGKLRPGRPPKNPNEKGSWKDRKHGGPKDPQDKDPKHDSPKHKDLKHKDPKDSHSPPPPHDRHPNSDNQGRRQPPKNWLGLILERLSGAIF